MKVRKHIFFSGRVQGVGFRWQSARLARNLGLTGWVRNLYDGRVEMEVQGEDLALARMLASLREDRYILIEDMEMTSLPLEEEKGFQGS